MATYRSESESRCFLEEDHKKIEKNHECFSRAEFFKKPYIYRCRILGRQENQGKCLISVEKKRTFFILLFLHRYLSDFNNFGCFEKPSDEAFGYNAFAHLFL